MIITWAAKEASRRHLGPRFDRNPPSFLTKAIGERSKLRR
jgi:hypothetical protein